MYCKKCGKQLEDNVQFCAACGQSVNDPVSETDGLSPLTPVEKAGGIVQGITFLVAIVLVVMSFIFLIQTCD
jgi:uncharacterized membrane protein YvbJ